MSLKWRPAAHEPLAGTEGNLRVLVVKPSAPLWLRNQVQGIGRKANLETGYDFGVYDPAQAWSLNTHAFLGIVGEDVAGLVIVEKHSHVIRVTWDELEAGNGREWDRTDADQWTIGFAWTAPDFRRRGVARRITAVATQFLGMSVDDIAWYTPFTDSGKALVKTLCPISFLIGK